MHSVPPCASTSADAPSRNLEQSQFLVPPPGLSSLRHEGNWHVSAHFLPFFVSQRPWWKMRSHLGGLSLSTQSVALGPDAFGAGNPVPGAAPHVSRQYDGHLIVAILRFPHFCLLTIFSQYRGFFVSQTSIFSQYRVFLQTPNSCSASAHAASTATRATRSGAMLPALRSRPPPQKIDGVDAAPS